MTKPIPSEPGRPRRPYGVEAINSHIGDQGRTLTLQQDEMFLINPDDGILLDARTFAKVGGVGNLAIEVAARIAHTEGMTAFLLRHCDKEVPATFLLSETSLVAALDSSSRQSEGMLERGQQIGRVPKTFDLNANPVVDPLHEGEGYTVGFHDLTRIASVRNLGAQPLQLTVATR